MAETARKNARVRPERLEARITAEQKRLIEQAAALEGRTVTDFVLTAVQAAAESVIERRQHLELSLRDREAFVDALLDPKPINDRLRETIRLYRQAAGA